MAVLLLGIGLPAGAIAQPLVQSVPNRNSLTLNQALARLGQNPRDIFALIDAGNAALAMGDVEAAVGFFRRADQIAPGNARVRAGLAAALVHSENPFDAIPMFEEAERAGAGEGALAGERGLAYDLVGDNEKAQRFYKLALASGSDDEITRRLALSYAIAGDKRSAETTLMPLLQRQDKAAWRTRAFSLAVMGQIDEAVSIANSTLPPSLAAGISPYLRYMPRLTPAQQAAAANLGHFPRASEIGRDDPRVALYAPKGPRRGVPLASADAALTPRGAPLGRGDKARDDRRSASDSRRDRRSRSESALAADSVGRTSATAATARTTSSSGSSRARTALAESARPSATRPAAPAPTSPARTPAPSPSLIPSRTAPAPTANAPAPATAPSRTASAPTTTPAPGPSLSLSSPAMQAAPAPIRRPAAAVQGPSSPIQGPPAPTTTSPLPAAVPPAPTSTSTTSASTAPAPTAPSPAPAAVATAPPAAAAPVKVNLADAFSDFLRPTIDVAPAEGAVDVRRLAPSRQATETRTTQGVVKNGKGPAAAKPAKPPPPSHPSRTWVQVATGRDKAALAFDWRRMARGEQAQLLRGKQAFISAWGQTNRLLTGPFPTEAAANAFLAQGRRAGLDGAFLWTSPAGQVVDPIAGK